MSETVKNGVGGEDLSDAEKIVSELGDFVKKAKEHKDYEEWREYSVPVKLGIDVEPILKTLKKNAYDFELDTTNSKYDDYLDGLLGVDVDREDFYDPITGDENDDAYIDARYESRLQKIDAMGEDESINDEYLVNGINRFTVEYHVDGGENRGDETLSYTRDMLGRKSMPYSMTTGLAELLMEKIDDNKPGVETLAEMPSFEEHMAEKEGSGENIEATREQKQIKKVIASTGLEDIAPDIWYTDGEKHINNELGNKEQAIYDINKREAIEKIFVGEDKYMQEIEDPDNLPREQKSLVKEALEDMIEFGTFALFNEENPDHDITKSYNDIFARYLGEGCNGTGSYTLLPKKRIKDLDDWHKKETQNDLMKLFNKYGIDVTNKEIREKALNGFIRTLTCGECYDNCWYFQPTLGPDDKVPETYGPSTNQAKWYYDTFALGKLQKIVGEDKMNSYIEEYKNQFPNIANMRGEEKHGVLNYCIDEFKRQHKIDGALFNQ